MYLPFPGCKLEVASQAARRTSQKVPCLLCHTSGFRTHGRRYAAACLPLDAALVRLSGHYRLLACEECTGARRLPCPARVLGGEVDVLARSACPNQISWP